MAEMQIQRAQPVLGWTGFFAGAAALVLALAMFWGLPLIPQPEPVADPSIAERAADAVRGILGREAQDAPAPPVEPTWSHAELYPILSLGVVGLGAAAVILGLAGFARREASRPAFSAVTLGGGAILFQLVTWVVLVLVCAMVVGAFARSGDGIGDILSGIVEVIGGFFSAIGTFFSKLFEGLFGG